MPVVATRVGAALLVAVLLLGGSVSAHVAAADVPGPTAARERAEAGMAGREPAAAGAIAPVPGGIVRRFDPPATRYGPGHRGVDLAADPGEAVRAALSGTVAFAGDVAGRGWVTVDHGGGLVTTYGWLAPRRVVRGDRVRTGTVLGRLAEDATHLDWGARLDGEYLDPLRLLGRWRARLVPLPPAG
jgi:murein DD-endopeptidase MepM/ murein hydrolase activator NlpD